MTAETVPVTHPARFRGAPERNARIARPLALLGRVREVDEGLVDEIGRRMLLRDEVGAELAAAMRPGSPSRVTMTTLERALSSGPADEDPAALRRFVAELEREPVWLDRDLLERGAAVYRRLGRTRDDVLLALALIGGYRYEGPADLLVETGGLTGAGAMRRLGETLVWGRAVSAPGGMARDGEGFRLTAHVRAMHAVVNDRFERSADWDPARLGLPINRSDLAGTLALFSATALLGARVLGWRITRAESDAVMHLWRYVGFLMGVDEDWLFTTERAQHAFDHHLLLAQGGPTPSGVALTTALVEGQRTKVGGGLRGWWERRRVLGHLRLFLGREGLRDLGQPVVVPWTVVPQVVRGVLDSWVVARFAAGRRWLERRSDRGVEVELERLVGRRRALAVVSPA
ncbi:oxygenase MpaB family protein [Actinomycetospora termitidis]|uniref:Oxygenase MpaB family protein n=1 Tax=Actinomycetospora termitidis TaxID=3053470 RepID=A0ABT7MIQ9_9PSEU|nr:oxygenase MpaB family protein [Actinomycetospora sp. Odt1-22]MDL5159223.1 oxygenase MpaB family protein [Actinomycetospora sp. Odt1-22]